jgi:aminoglycoside phosphotransferase (APT) family kinase protein
MPEARDLALESVQRIAVGWSHETWLFDLTWREAGESRRRALCLRRDPGNALLRHLSDLEQQYRVLVCLEPTPLPTPRPYWFEPDAKILGGPFLVMERVPGVCPNPWGREGRAFYAAAAARGRPSRRCIRSTGAPPGSTSSARRRPAPASRAARSRSGAS